jgi:hypothetical protein
MGSTIRNNMSPSTWEPTVRAQHQHDDFVGLAAGQCPMTGAVNA